MLGPPGIERDIKWLSGECELFSTDDKLIVLCGQLTAYGTMVARGLKHSSAWRNRAELSVCDCSDLIKKSLIHNSDIRPDPNH